MKITGFLTSILFLFMGCSPNIEKRASLFAEKEVIKILNDASTYESVDTQVDSAFMSIYIDYDACLAACELTELEEKLEGLLGQYDSQKSSAAIWADSDSALGKEEYRQAKKEIERVYNQIEDTKKKIEEKELLIKERKATINDGEYCGWIIQHRFRCANGLGIKMLNDILLVSDPDFENLVIRMMLDEDDSQGFENIKKKIDEVLGV